jgi:hypothetical protein
LHHCTQNLTILRQLRPGRGGHHTRTAGARDMYTHCIIRYDSVNKLVTR